MFLSTLCWQCMQANMWLYDFQFVLLSFMSEWNGWRDRCMQGGEFWTRLTNEWLYMLHELPFCFWSSLLQCLLIATLIYNRLYAKFHNVQNLIFAIHKCTKSIPSFSIREGLSVAIFSGEAIHLSYTPSWHFPCATCNKASFCIDEMHNARGVCEKWSTTSPRF